MKSLLADTGRMQSSVNTLQNRLEASSREANELREALQRAQGEALTDPLTALTNRRGFDKAVEDALKQPGGLIGFSLIMADIDHFKKVNDTYGHLFGDKVIRNAAQVLKGSVKGRDTAGRALAAKSSRSCYRKPRCRARARWRKIFARRLRRVASAAPIRPKKSAVSRCPLALPPTSKATTLPA